MSMRVAFFGYLADGNIGNDASFEACFDWLRSVRPDAEAFAITSNPAEFQRAYGLPATAISSWRPSGKKGLGPELRRIAARASDIWRTYSVVGRADVVVIPGMGVLEDSIPVGPWGLPLSMVMLGVFCRVRRAPLLLVGVGAEPAHRCATRVLYRLVAALAHHVSFRDHGSAVAMGAGERCVIPDLAFAHPSRGRRSPRKGVVAVGIMAPHWRPGGDNATNTPPGDSYLARVSGVIEGLLKAGNDVILVTGDTADVPTMCELRQRALTLTSADQDRVSSCSVTTFEALTRALEGAEVVVASRFHNLVCAARLGVPLVALGYAPKAAELMESLGQERFCLDVRSFQVDEVLELISEARQGSAGISAQLRSATAGYREQVSELLESTRPHFGG